MRLTHDCCCEGTGLGIQAKGNDLGMPSGEAPLAEHTGPGEFVFGHFPEPGALI